MIAPFLQTSHFLIASSENSITSIICPLAFGGKFVVPAVWKL